MIYTIAPDQSLQWTHRTMNFPEVSSIEILNNSIMAKAACLLTYSSFFLFFFLQFDNPVYEASDGELYYQKNGEVEHQYTVFRETHENDTKVSSIHMPKHIMKWQFKLKIWVEDPVGSWEPCSPPLPKEDWGKCLNSCLLAPFPIVFLDPLLQIENRICFAFTSSRNSHLGLS